LRSQRRPLDGGGWPWHLNVTGVCVRRPEPEIEAIPVERHIGGALSQRGAGGEREDHCAEERRDELFHGGYSDRTGQWGRGEGLFGARRAVLLPIEARYGPSFFGVTVTGITLSNPDVSREE
jgi:hypothetical protein